MWTAETFYSEFCKQILIRQMGDHNFIHQIDINELRKRYKTLKGKVASNLCHLTEDELIEGMKEAALLSSDDMAAWLNSSIKTKDDWQEYIDFDFDKKIGQLVGKPKWLNGEYIETEGSELIVVLSKMQRNDGSFTFKITTAYCEVSYEEKKLEKLKRGLN